LDELSEVQKQKEREAQETDLVQRAQAKDLAKLNTDINQLQVILQKLPL